MSGLNARSQSGETGENEEFTANTLSTGLENLDHAFEENGIRIGSVVALLADPESPGDILAANMIANRPTYYYTLTRSADHIRRNIEPLSNVSLDQVNIRELDSDDPIGTLREEISKAEFPRGVTVIIDPVNNLEMADSDAYKSFLRELQSNMESQDGLAVLYGVETDVDPKNRWMTTYSADTVFEILHRTADETVKDYLAIQKLYPGQELIDTDNRVFELEQDLDMDIATSRNISP